MAKYYKYTSNSGIVGRTLHQKTAAKAAVDPDAEISTDVGAPLFESTETTRSKGLRPRMVELVRVNTDTGVIAGVLRVPIATATRWNAIAATDSFEINNQTWKVRRKIAEEFGV